MKVCFETFGCRLNKAEALQMEAEYLAKGWTLTEKHSEADLFVVRGCSVTRRAQSECEHLIEHLRHRYPTTPIKICGCLKSGKAPVTSLRQGRANSSTRRDGNVASPVPTRTARAYLKVQDGCSGACSFCIVPQFRGKSVSVPFAEVIDKAKRFADAGYHEIVVTGCNLSLYASQSKRLPQLLEALAELSPDVRLRLGSLEPGSCAMDTVKVMAASANVCRFLHIPVQSGSNRILSLMRRPYALKDIEALCAKAAELMPNLGLGCDVMTGFPGEENADFSATRLLLERHPFSNAHVFPYSERPGTAAVALLGAIPKEVRSARAHELAKLIAAKRDSFAVSFIGKTVEIVVEDKGRCKGWSSEYLPCSAIGNVPRRSFARIFVTNAKDGKLTGRLDHT